MISVAVLAAGEHPCHRSTYADNDDRKLSKSEHRRLRAFDQSRTVLPKIQTWSSTATIIYMRAMAHSRAPIIYGLKLPLRKKKSNLRSLDRETCDADSHESLKELAVTHWTLASASARWAAGVYNR